VHPEGDNRLADELVARIDAVAAALA
jgi:hypothetical protein